VVDLQDPAWFPVTVDAGADQLGFVHTGRAALSAAPFLDARFAPPDAATPVALATVRASTDSAAARPVPLVFHTAFCCSTLLASALDRPGTVLSLKEPDLLMQLANLRRVPGDYARDDRRFAALLQLALALLGRRFAPDERVLVKPTNAANLLMPWALDLAHPALLLHVELADFLVSVLKKGEAGRYFVRHLFNILRLDRPDIDGWPERQRMLLTDLQVAALVWQMQMDLYLQVLSVPGALTRVRTLHAAQLLSRPRDALGAVDRFFQLGLGARALDDAVAGPTFSRHSKFVDVDYDSTQREAERRDVEQVHGKAIAATLKWAEKLGSSELPSRLAACDVLAAVGPAGA
jgi:hypothetical protein